MDKVDYKKHFKDFYHTKIGKPVVVQVPKMNFIMIDGKGDPNTSQEYIDAIQALYPVAYTIKFTCKNKYGKDFGVMPLEGLWWSDNMEDFITGNKKNWQWTAMIMQPEAVTEDIFNEAVIQVKEKKNLRSIDKIRYTSYDEGRSAQVMYMGPYSDEGPTILELHKFIKEQGGELDENNKHHHEIYLGDPRRTDPSKLKTIIRQPF
ncbi:MAG TPA: GyrI-like domain-containing protein [Candidatus Saccharibacteria bacterium]|nr:GyrI-like domain-containing protein [Candidatus Saccharibacteria bacterium]